MSRVTIVDYGMGNLRSIAKAFERCGASTEIVSDSGSLGRAERIVVPGQGAFGQAMTRLERLGVADALREALERERPFLGVCLGLQILYEASEEAPGVAGLGVVRGMVSLLPSGPLVRRPHMGWTPVEHDGRSAVMAANPTGEPYYFVHSYAALNAPGCIVARATSGLEFVAALARGPLFATQFHPEKSQVAGGRLLSAWLAM